MTQRIPGCLFFVALLALLPGVHPAAGQSLELETAATPAGLGVYHDGGWGVAQVKLANPGDADAEGLALVRMAHGARGDASEGSPDAGAAGETAGEGQFGTRAWVPAGAARTVTVPIHFGTRPSGAKTFELETLLIRGGAGREVATPASPTSLIRAEPKQQAVAVINPGRRDGALEALRSLLNQRGDRARLVTLYANGLNAISRPMALDAVETVVVVSADGGGLGAAQEQVLHDWLVAGGRLWLMIDGPGVESLGQRLLGGAWGVVRLGRTQVVDVPLDGLGGKENEAVRDTAYDMARVVWPGAEVVHEVDGYPAVLQLEVGRGRVMVTTLGPEAFVADGQVQQGPMGRTLNDFMISTAKGLQEADAAATEAATRAALRDFSRGQVGYQVPGRGGVLAILVVFIAALGGSAWWFTRGGRPERFAWAGVGLALVAGGVLVGLGLVQQSAVPSTFAVTGVTYYPPGQPDAVLRSTVSLYRSPLAPDPGRVSGRGVVPMPDERSAGGTRLVWTDRDAWTYEIFDTSPGVVHTLRTRGVVRPADSLTAMLDPTTADGQGVVRGLAEGAGLRDALLVTPDGRYAARVTRDGGFSLPSETPLAPGDFVGAGSAGGVLDSRQIAHAAVAAAVADHPEIVTGPTLLAWTRGEDPGVFMDAGDPGAPNPAGLVQPRETIVALPLRVATLPAGSTVHLPPALMRMDLLSGQRSITAFDPINRTWLSPIAAAQTVWVEFRPLVPFRLDALEEVRLRLDLDAPQRPVRLLTQSADGAARELTAFDSPRGVLTLTLRGEQLPALHQDGAVVLGLDIADQPAERGPSPGWTLRRIDLGLTATPAPAPGN